MPGEALAGDRSAQRTAPARPARGVRMVPIAASSLRLDRFVPAVLSAVVVVCAGGIAMSRRFDGLYGQDAFAYFDYATGPLRHALISLQPWPTFFWPPGYPLLVSLTSTVLGPQPLAGQLISLVMGGIAAGFTFLLACELELDLAGAILAGLIVALCGQLWQSSMVVMSDTTGLACATIGAWSLVRYARHQSLSWVLLGAFALSYATLARWIYSLVGVPCAVYALMVLRRDRALLHATLAVVVAALVLVPILGPGLVGALTAPHQDASFAGNLQVYSWSPLNAFRRDFFTADGHLSYTLPNGVYYALLAASPAYAGPLLAAAALPGVYAASHEWQRPSVVLIVGWAAVVYAFHAGAPWQNIRFALAYLPPLAILAAAGLSFAWHRVRQKQVVTVYALLGLVVMLVGGVRLNEAFIDRKDDDLALVSWVDSQVSPGAQLLSFGPTLTLQHYSDVPTRDLYEIAPDELGHLMDRPTYVLVDEANIEDQWRGQFPERDFRALRDGVGLSELGQRSGLTLFRVDGT